MDKVNSQKMMIILLSIAVVILLILWRLKPDPVIISTMPDNQQEIDSLREVIKQQEQNITSIEHSKSLVIDRIILKKKAINNEKEKYYTLDSTGRIDHFRTWVRDSTTE